MTNLTSTTIRVALIAAVAASLIVSSISGMATQAFAEKDKKDDNNRHNSSVPRDMAITKTGIKNHFPYIKVQGIAGGTKPTGEDSIFGYFIFTNKGIWTINAHAFSHGLNTADEQWHNEQVRFTYDNHNNPVCLTWAVDGADDHSDFVFKGHDVIFTKTGATKVERAMTMQLVHLMDGLQGCPDGSIAKVVTIFGQVTPKHNGNNDKDE
jgi:hypothetical protein